MAGGRVELWATWWATWWTVGGGGWKGESAAKLVAVVWRDGVVVATCIDVS